MEREDGGEGGGRGGEGQIKSERARTEVRTWWRRRRTKQNPKKRTKSPRFSQKPHSRTEKPATGNRTRDARNYELTNHKKRLSAGANGAKPGRAVPKASVPSSIRIPPTVTRENSQNVPFAAFNTKPVQLAKRIMSAFNYSSCRVYLHICLCIRCLLLLLYCI